MLVEGGQEIQIDLDGEGRPHQPLEEQGSRRLESGNVVARVRTVEDPTRAGAIEMRSEAVSHVDDEDITLIVLFAFFVGDERRQVDEVQLGDIVYLLRGNIHKSSKGSLLVEDVEAVVSLPPLVYLGLDGAKASGADVGKGLQVERLGEATQILGAFNEMATGVVELREDTLNLGTRAGKVTGKDVIASDNVYTTQKFGAVGLHTVVGGAGDSEAGQEVEALPGLVVRGVDIHVLDDHPVHHDGPDVRVGIDELLGDVDDRRDEFR